MRRGTANDMHTSAPRAVKLASHFGTITTRESALSPLRPVRSDRQALHLFSSLFALACHPQPSSLLFLSPPPFCQPYIPSSKCVGNVPSRTGLKSTVTSVFAETARSNTASKMHVSHPLPPRQGGAPQSTAAHAMPPFFSPPQSVPIETNPNLYLTCQKQCKRRSSVPNTRNRNRNIGIQSPL